MTAPDQETVMVEVPETDRPPAPVVGVDVPVEAPTMTDGSAMPVPLLEREGQRA